MENNLPILITRAQPDNEISVKKWQAIGLNAIAAPLLQFCAIGNKLDLSNDYGAVIFTSANGVRALEKITPHHELKKLPAFCVGDHSANIARFAGFINVKSASSNTDNLVKLLIKHKNTLSKKILYSRAKNISKDIKSLCKPTGLFVDNFIIYECNLLKHLYFILKTC